MYSVKDLCQEVMIGVIKTGVVTDNNTGIACEIMKEEVKALFTGEKYESHRECIQSGSLHDGYILADLILECVQRIHNHE